MSTVGLASIPLIPPNLTVDTGALACGPLEFA